jgi:hypothetical protein
MGTVRYTTNETPTGNVVEIINISSEIPKEFSLSQNIPNPFNPTTKIRFSLPRPSEGGEVGKRHAFSVQLIVFDVLGREVSTLFSSPPDGGRIGGATYEVEFDGTNYPSGLYFYKLTANEYAETRKMILIK